MSLFTLLVHRPYVLARHNYYVYGTSEILDIIKL